MPGLPLAPSVVVKYIIGRSNGAGRQAEANRLPDPARLPPGPIADQLLVVHELAARRRDELARLRAGIDRRAAVHAAGAVAERDALVAGRKLAEAVVGRPR